MQLMGKLWESYDVKKYARRGHVQHGVDFFGTSLRGVCGGQSKLHEATNALTKKEVLKEIKKAEGFKPKLDTYVILTTTKRDSSKNTSGRPSSCAKTVRLEAICSFPAD